MRAADGASFVLIASVMLAGIGNGAWWIFIPLGVAGLSIVSLPKYLDLWPRSRDVGAEAMWWKTVGLSVFNTLGATCAAFVTGAAVRYVLW